MSVSHWHPPIITIRQCLNFQLSNCSFIPIPTTIQIEYIFRMDQMVHSATLLSAYPVSDSVWHNCQCFFQVVLSVLVQISSILDRDVNFGRRWCLVSWSGMLLLNFCNLPFTFNGWSGSLEFVSSILREFSLPLRCQLLFHSYSRELACFQWNHGSVDHFQLIGFMRESSTNSINDLLPNWCELVILSDQSMLPKCRGLELIVFNFWLVKMLWNVSV